MFKGNATDWQTRIRLWAAINHGNLCHRIQYILYPWIISIEAMEDYLEIIGYL